MSFKTRPMLGICLLCLMLFSCSETAKMPEIAPYYPLVKISTADYPDFKDDLDKAGLMSALEQSLLYYDRVSPDTLFSFGEEQYDARHMQRSLTYFLEFLKIDPSREQLQSFLQKHYAVYTTMMKRAEDENTVNESAVKDSSKGRIGKRDAGKEDIDLFSEVLFTGYYEPSIPGSRTKDNLYRYPIYSRPDDLIVVRPGRFSSKYQGMPSLVGRVDGNELVPYYTRSEINAMKGYEKRAKPVAWLQSRIDRFFLEIQGSGRVVLPDGEVLRVQYSAKNGRPYRAIGGYLIEKGEISREKMSMQAIRKWLEAHPQRMDEVLHTNPGVVFFQEGKGGPYGCLGVAVTPMRSIATDVSIFPKGALCFMETPLPVMEEGIGDKKKFTADGIKPREAQTKITTGNGEIKKAVFSGFVLNQDTGGAIKGAGRADFFCGNGVVAEYVAGHMKERGRLYFLVLKEGGRQKP